MSKLQGFHTLCKAFIFVIISWKAIQMVKIVSWV